MALTSTLFTGLSGLDVNQTRLNVVGNNIANTNTVAFKSSRALFKPQFYVTDSPGTSPDGAFGGANPNQRGLGAQVSSIEKDFTQGPIEPTGRKDDLAIDGLGFFVVGEGEKQFTRDGSFKLNEGLDLTTTDGEYVQGYGIDDTFNLIPTRLGRIHVPLGGATAAEATTKADLSGNMNAGGPLSTGASVLESQSFKSGTGALSNATLLTDLTTTGATPTTLFAGADVLTLAGKKGEGTLPASTFTVAGKTVGDLITFVNGGLAISTTQVVGTGTAGAAFKTDPADTTGATGTLTVTGNTGLAHKLTLGQTALTKANGTPPFSFRAGTDAANNVDGPIGESKKTTVAAFDSLGTPIDLDVTLSLKSRSDAGTVWDYSAESEQNTSGLLIGTGTVSFGPTGQFLNSDPPTITVQRTNTGAVPVVPIDLNFKGMTALTDTTSAIVGNADGYKKGTLTDYSIGSDGSINGSFDNGLTRTLGQIALATFKNPMGLQDTGSNLYKAGANSGDPQITAPRTLDAGSVRSGSLELSNVDLSKEFTNLIIASTGFSASSRVISTSSQLLSELLNTAR